ncbi:TonB-dependent receptor [Pseudomonas soli]|uniref:TonB-dependent receptor n=1 Tax=Pseudomonas soli TaxID=1306993 RepID=A0ABU7GJB7_9PSED|nr:TonB-dependent receptor [Pseudomonas soli]MDT3712382.1 TonB-dependent receptor [Pseudomonas soli]MDT3729719.1 TonB-dependent receptor [Pseudomonas soli]MEE1879045.1 TonB-dependent receptor [Pseudomonas soli]NBK41035.1 TonB-dependent receptor [Pseudomonas soli]WJO24446.1 TonB-dependent receptor [Pseudomonas soli]
MSLNPLIRPLSTPVLLLALGLPGMSWADDAPRRSYQIPAGSLAAALTRFAGQAGVNLSVDPALVAGHGSNGLAGEYAVEEGFTALLRGSGLHLVPAGQGGYTLMRQIAPGDGAHELPSTTINGQGIGSASDSYAGGQVSRRGSQGLLGERDYMDTPFNITSYTSELLQNQQARTLADAVANDPSVRTTNPSAGRFEQFSVRGFSLYNSDVAYGGLYGVLPTYSIDMEMVDRVDILKGPGALLGGLAPNGSVGGGVNIEPKRAGETPLTEFTALYASAGQGGGHVDIGRRFGEGQRFGLRLNAVRQAGDTEWEHQRLEREASVLGFDVRGERLRLSLDVGHQQRDVDAPMERVGLNPGVNVPHAKAIHHNFAQPWSYSRAEDTFGAVRGEYDVSDNWMVHGALGARKGDYDFLRHAVQVTNDAGRFSVSPRAFQREEKVITGTVGVRGWFDTGAVGHTLNISLNRFDMTFDNSGARYAAGVSNLFDPVALAAPGTTTALDNPTHTKTLLSSLALADTLSLAEDRVLLTLGARLQRVEVDSSEPGEPDQRYDEHATSPALGLVWRSSERLSLYLNYMEGLTQGQVAPETANNAGKVFAPYRSKQVEVGAKYDAGSFSTTLSLFRIDKPAYYTDAQNNLRADGEQRNQGLELNLFGEPLAGVRLLGGAMLLDAEQTRTADGRNDGNRAIGAPIVNANLGVEWDLPAVAGLTLGARVIHTGNQYLDAANQQKIDAWQRYDLGARYALKLGGKAITLRASVENVLDKAYWASANVPEGTATGLTLSTPRTWLVSATVGF